ncbi:GPALPP motifs-containing protein 1 [Topomyia yanbarensis]|uniref:GPALPP motifs-containing protein 1 n=1 Tax=Topomyia yanbarensis TaxID=2498891 RepID=UPI00273AD9F4|nr:GPALPP motifs-containing protein 1 [Topomyia yanbarensis]XP_058821687.1 GPALPP motifs-containing protein 1 [Topomyia yanbarensis]
MSDTDTSDSDSGIRFKTTSTRYKTEGPDKYSSSSKSTRSVASNSRNSRDNDRGRDRYRERDSRHTSRRSRKSCSRSKSRSRSIDRRKRRETERRSHRSRSRSRSRSKRSSHGRRERRSSSENKLVNPIIKPEVKIRNTDDQLKSKQSKILDISISSLSSQEDTIVKDEASESSFGPALPPTIPDHANEFIDNESKEEKTDEFGPALPPDLVKKYQAEETVVSNNGPRVIGPTLPANMKINTEPTESSESELSPFSEEEEESARDDEDMIGPLPGGSSSRANLELEQRALEIKLKRLDESKSVNVTSREDWMLELPDIRKVSDMGLGARQFRTREKQEIGDRTVWTDTPSDKERKKSGHSSKDPIRDREEEQQRRRVAERDRQQEEMVKKHKKKHKRDKSLLDIHKKKLEEDKKNKDVSSEPIRRPFDRNVDLHANRFDEAQKKAIFKKAQLLDTRFSSGASKFL